MKQLSRIILSTALSLAAGTALASTVEVRVSGVTAKGKVNVAVCDKARFLKQCAYSASVPAQAGETTVTVKDVPPGTWAVLAYQDKNGNDELDRNLIGIPKEAYGFSRDARGKFGPPSFEDAAIEVGETPATASVRLR
ncbi:DUF2141 domain-containing protein [Massilia sp. Mn16-1_5]|uniref:DUF2141 domain-containing protein n=1 Tax=Massilia sp. Mn16-1_5 TaxID=2079199 RepID=UPI00109EC0B4|nr:DUF2141 domain-containing protein [Massilia sp. Mn16-1_5]THC45797.1 hypothetical protein C2862_04770 [Massilia sp. Mn16-1_5]